MAIGTSSKARLVPGVASIEDVPKGNVVVLTWRFETWLTRRGTRYHIMGTL